MRSEYICHPDILGAVRGGGVAQEELPHHTAMSEVAIHISNHTVLKGDRGLIVVGAASHLGDISSHAALSKHPQDQQRSEAPRR